MTVPLDMLDDPDFTRPHIQELLAAILGPAQDLADVIGDKGEE